MRPGPGESLNPLKRVMGILIGIEYDADAYAFGLNPLKRVMGILMGDWVECGTMQSKSLNPLKRVMGILISPDKWLMYCPFKESQSPKAGHGYSNEKMALAKKIKDALSQSPKAGHGYSNCHQCCGCI